MFLGFCAVNPTGVLNARSDTETQSETPFDLKAIVRLNHEDAKIFTIFLKRALKSYEEAEGEIKLPAEFVEAIELTADEW